MTSIQAPSSSTDLGHDSWDEDSDIVLETDSDNDDYDMTQITAMTENTDPSVPAHNFQNGYPDDGESGMDLDSDFDSEYEGEDENMEEHSLSSPTSVGSTFFISSALDVEFLREMAAEAAPEAPSQAGASLCNTPLQTFTESRTLQSHRPLSTEEIQQAASRILNIRSNNGGAVQKPPQYRPCNMLAGLIARPELMELVAQWLDPDSLCILYCVSKSFHHLMNTRYSFYIKACASIWAPYGRQVFPFHAFRKLCIRDPASRPNPNQPDRARHVPGIKYLKMIVFRQNIVDEILAALDRAGHRLPRDAHITLQKIWLTMSIPGSGARIGLLHNPNYWANDDLYLATHFFLKLDMHCNDPVEGDGDHMIRDVFLSKHSLFPLHRLLHGGYTPLQMVQHYVAYDYHIPINQARTSILGIPAHLVGQGCVEGWGTGNARALGIGEGVMLESVRRGLEMHNHYVDMILYGYSSFTDHLAFDLAVKEPRNFNAKEKAKDWRLRQHGLEHS